MNPLFTSLRRVARCQDLQSVNSAHMGESYRGSQERHEKGGGDGADARKIRDGIQKTIQKSEVI